MFASFISSRMRYRSQATTLMFLFLSICVNAQPVSTTAQNSAVPSSIPAKSLIALPGVAANTKGDLSFNNRELKFTTKDSSSAIAKGRIIAVSSGDERVETGGTTGKIARVVIPYGGGLALASVTHKKVGLLTIEFLDASGEYHGAVFALDTDEMDSALGRLALRSPSAIAPHASVSVACPNWKIQPNAVRVDVVDSDEQSGFPAEYRVLLYEHLVDQLKSEKTILNVYRAGDRSPEAHCAEFTVIVHPIAFNKGDQALRASVGPLGHFVGTTKLNFRLIVAKQDGSSIFNGDISKSEGSDTDSLNITKVIGKTVVKTLKKSRTQLHKAQST